MDICQANYYLFSLPLGYELGKAFYSMSFYMLDSEFDIDYDKNIDYM